MVQQTFTRIVLDLCLLGRISSWLVLDHSQACAGHAGHQEFFQDSEGHVVAWQDLSLACAGYTGRQDLYQDSGGD